MQNSISRNNPEMNSGFSTMMRLFLTLSILLVHSTKLTSEKPASAPLFPSQVTFTATESYLCPILQIPDTRGCRNIYVSLVIHKFFRV